MDLPFAIITWLAPGDLDLYLGLTCYSFTVNIDPVFVSDKVFRDIIAHFTLIAHGALHEVAHEMQMYPLR